MKKATLICAFLLSAAATLEASAGCIMMSGRYCSDQDPKACSSDEVCTKKENGTECHCVKAASAEDSKAADDTEAE
jgi:hypothetical protein